MQIGPTGLQLTKAQPFPKSNLVESQHDPQSRGHLGPRSWGRQAAERLTCGLPSPPLAFALGLSVKAQTDQGLCTPLPLSSPLERLSKTPGEREKITAARVSCPHLSGPAERALLTPFLRGAVKESKKGAGSPGRWEAEARLPTSRGSAFT